MPAVMERPVIDQISDTDLNTDNDMQPTWVLLVHETANQSWLDIGNILLKIMPELSREKINTIAHVLKMHQVAPVYKDLKPVVERYYERLQKNQLKVTMEKE